MNVRGLVAVILAVSVGALAGVMGARDGFSDNWQALAVVWITGGWVTAVLLGTNNPIQGWQPRYDPDGKVYAWMRPIEQDIVWTMKIGTFKWALHGNRPSTRRAKEGGDG